MRINSVQVKNFRAITSLTLDDLRDTIVIAGPNGCGKSCLFDAIRLLKSAYGGYQPNEWHHWFGEFQININLQNTDMLSVFQDKSKSLQVSANFALSLEEKEYLRAHIKDLLREQTWKQIAPELAGWRHVGTTPLAAHLRIHKAEVEKRVKKELPKLRKLIESDEHRGTVTITPEGEANTTPSRILELVFGTYDPQNLGIIDYHGANRNYAREQVGGINLNIETSDERMRQHALYNYANKYANLKTEMAGGYIRQLLAAQADQSAAPDQNLSDTLKELFQTFFPGKQFVGPTPTMEGRLHFPVRTANGSEHDIDELSSGEKEVLYGYLRLRNSSPRNSVLLIDEPELHLNPRLITGLASFYHRHLGRPLGTQLWLVTHSDTLIREAVGQEGFSVFHLQPSGTYDGLNQASPVAAAADLDRLVIELVGDLAAYRPGAKIVVFEGDGDDGFDVRMALTLFPELQAKTNAISGGNKRRVTQLYDLLDEARSKGHLPGKFYAVTDSDGDIPVRSDLPRKFSWNVYHIENYLLAPRFIFSVLKDLNRHKGRVKTEAGVQFELKRAAEKTITGLVSHRLRLRANQALLDSIDLRFDPAAADVSAAINSAISRSVGRIVTATQSILAPAALSEQEGALRRKFTAELADGTWIDNFRGRDVLKRFVGLHGGGLDYEAFRDLIVARMRDADYRPPGMKLVIDAILAEGYR